MTILALMVSVLAAASPLEDPAPGVTSDLARERAARVSALRYETRLAIPLRVSDEIRGETVIRFRLSDAGTPLVLDFQRDPAAVRFVRANGAAAEARVVNGHIVIPAAALRPGENAIEIGFVAGDEPLNRSADYLYSLFVPGRASLALPVFDQPDLKGRFSLTLEIPAAWKAVANGAEQSRVVSGDRALVRFAETLPIPTYLFGFVAGAWEVETAERSGRVYRMYHREPDPAKVARNRDAIFDLMDGSVTYMERYTGIPFPFGKYDFVLVPSFQFGGMEHPGAVLYNASSLLLDESATQNQRLARASLLAHETAHHWFGDLVTMRWFDDVWMKEVFANLMAAKIVNPSFPAVNHDLRFLLAHYPAAYGVDRTAGSHPIRQKLDNLDEAAQLYGAIIYQKAPIAMRQLEQLVGEEAFRVGMAEYLRAYAYGNADWPELIAILDRISPEDLRPWSEVWIEQAGRPTLEASWTAAAGRLGSLTVSQLDPVGQGRTWTQPTTLALVYPDSVVELPVRLHGPALEVEEARGLPEPLAVVLNGDARAYGLVRLDPASQAWLVEHFAELESPVLRGAVWLDLWDAVLEGRLRPSAFVDLALRAIPREADEQMANRILGSLDHAFWQYLTPRERETIAPRLETALWQALGSVEGTSRKSAVFAALRSSMLTPGTVARMRDVWARDTTIADLPLSDQDLTTLALELAVRGVDGADSLLAAQQGRVQNPDLRDRIAFLRPALSPDPATRAAWFASLAQLENRRREPWVLDGLAYLNHPLRADASIGFILPALELLAEVRRTGDIFFPGQWISTVLGGHASPEAAQIVRAFLAAHPDYPPRLTQLVLQAADDLFRAARLTPSP